MFSKMLVATDLSEASDALLRALGRLEKLGTKEAVLVYCFSIFEAEALANRFLELAEPALNRQKALLEGMGFSTTAKLTIGPPQVEIKRQADEESCSFIVVGAHGRSLLGENVLGGVTSGVVHSATRPVMVLRPNDREFLGNILFPTDFSQNAEYAYTFVKKLAAYKAERITLLHVQDEAKLGTHLKHKLEEFNVLDSERLNRMKDELLRLGAGEVSVEVTFGSPKGEIVKKINESGVNLTVIGSQGKGYAGGVFLGSVSHAVARKAQTSLLLIPASV